MNRASVGRDGVRPREEHMTTTFRLLAVVCICLLSPAAARADDGGWWEWLEKMSGPRMRGIGTDVHLLCLDDTGKAFACERLFGGFADDKTFKDIKHQIDFRVGFYWKVGERFSDVGGDTGSIFAWKLMALYHYHVHPQLNVGVGAGYLPVFGKDFDLFSRGIITPVSVVWAPLNKGGVWGRSFYVRAETSYITQGMSGADFNNPTTKFATKGEWNSSFAIGFDFRRGRNP